MVSQANQAWMAGEQALARREPSRAEREFRRALAADAHHAPALIGLSTALSQLRRHRDAHAAILRAFASRPPVAPVLFALAQRLRYFHEFAALVDTLTAPAFTTQAPPAVLANGASMLSSVGAHGEAMVLVEEGLRRGSNDATCLYVRGNFHMFRGDNERAEACYEASLRADPLLFQNSMMLAAVRRATPERNHVERFRAQLSKARPGGNGEVYLYFALHRQLHDLGRHDEAWDALERGCRAKRRQLKYSIAGDEALANRLAAVCTRRFIDDASPEPQPAQPVFIIGMHRSGTTLLERMLAGHSMVRDAGETPAFLGEMGLAVDRAVPDGPDAVLVDALAGADFDAIARGYARSARWLSRGRPVFTEKLPQNFLNAGFIAKAIPRARFLHLVRDPMDTCFSNLRQLFSGAAPYSYDQVELGRFYGVYRRTMAHWHDAMPGRILDVHYDRLVADPEGTAREVAAHCGLPFEPGMVDVARDGGAVSTPSAVAVHQGFQANRGQVWRHYAGRLGTLRALLEEEGGVPAPE